jgi:hypothetical protein
VKVEALEATFIDFANFLLNCGRRIYFLDRFTTLISATSHNILLHLELQTAVVPHQPFILPVLAFSEH